MEATLATNQQIPLIGELALGLSPSAPYITARSQVTCFCQQNVCKFDGTNTMQFNLGSATQWCDPKSVAISFVIHNLDSTHELEFLSANPEILFDRLVVTLGGTIVEDQHHYARTSTLFSRYQSTEKQLEQAALGLGAITKHIYKHRNYPAL